MAKKGGSNSSSSSCSTSRYIELGEREARDKVGHALRDLAVSTIHHSTMAKFNEAQKKKHKQQHHDHQRPKTKEDEKSVKKKEPEPSLPAAGCTESDKPMSNEEEEDFFHQALSLFLTVCDDSVEDRDVIIR
jgi:hypothetical protein